MNSYNIIVYDKNNEEYFNGWIKAQDENKAVINFIEFCKLEDGDVIEIYKGE